MSGKTTSKQHGVLRAMTMPWSVLLGLVLSLSTATCLADVALEYQLKAAFIQKFTKFIEWPDDRADSPLFIAVIGDNVLRDAIKDLAQQGEGGRPLTLADPSAITDASKPLHILYIGSGEGKHAESILRSLGKRSLLTIGESDDFCSLGGTVNFYLMDEKIRFEINPDAGSASGLKISSKLLKLARICKTDSRAR